MKLDKEDIKQIRGVVKTEANSIVGGVEKRLEKKIDESMQGSETRLRKEINVTVVGAKNEIIATLSREINDLAEINSAVISKVSKIAELEKRIIRIEHKIGIAE